MTGADLSLSTSFDAACPVCGTAFAGMQWQIVDMSRRPELLTRVCDGSAQRSYCPQCIGPGAEKPGALALVRRVEGRFEVLMLCPRGDGPAARAEIEALGARVTAHCRNHGIAASQIVWQGSALTGRAEDPVDAIQRTWEGTEIPWQDPTLAKTILYDLLNAQDTAARASVVLAHLDLARPNIEKIVAELAYSTQGAQRVAAEKAMSFLASAKRIGTRATLEREQRKEAQAERAVEAIRSLPGSVWTQYLQFQEIQFHTEEEFNRAIEFGETLCEALRGEDVRIFRAATFGQLAYIWERRSENDQAESVDKAIDAYGRVLAEVDADSAEDNCRILLKLSALWDRRSSGNRRENLEKALVSARRAVALGEQLPREMLAGAWMEVGILLTHHLAGDPVSNAILAREALANAKALALTASLRLLALYNEALTYIDEADAHRPGNPLDLGISMLQVVARQPVEELFNAEQRQNLYQTLGTALAKRASRAGGDVAELDVAAGYVAKAILLANEGNRPLVAARNLSFLAAIQSDRLVGGRQDIEVAEIFGLIDEAAKTLTAERAPFEFALNEMRRAALVTKLIEPGCLDDWIRDAYEKVCTVLTPQSAPHLCRAVRYQLARHYLKKGDLTAAANSLTSACEAAENVLVATDTTGQRAQELEPNAELYELYVDTLQRVAASAEGASPDASWQVLEAMERGRARLYLDRMSLGALPQFAGIPLELLERERALLAGLDAGSRIGEVELNTYAGIDAGKLRDQQETHGELQALWKEIAATGEGGRKHVAFRNARPPDRAALEQLGTWMGASCAALSFFVLGDRILATLLREGESPQTESVQIDSARLHTEFLDAYAEDIIERPGDILPEDVGEHAWCKLGEELFAPFAPAIAKLDVLILVPHGPLHALPLHALTLAGRPLIEHVAVAFAPSLGVLRSLLEGERRSGKKEEALVVSHAQSPDEVDSFEGEANRVAQLCNTGALHHAKLEEVIEKAPLSSLIHLACHGYFDANDPLNSAVELADGPLSARGWLTLKLSARLVTLSACETGVQQVRRGDELQGLGRTLIEAGAASVLLTLWRVVSDSTAEWMKFFYEELERDPSSQWHLAHAFRAATLELYRLDSDPLYWAPFVLVGDPR